MIYFVVSFLICLARSCLCGILLWGRSHNILKNPLGFIICNSIPPLTLYPLVLNISSINCQPLPAQFTSGWLISGWHWDHSFSYANPTNSLCQHAVYPFGGFEIGQSHLQSLFHLHTENGAFGLLNYGRAITCWHIHGHVRVHYYCFFSFSRCNVIKHTGNVVYVIPFHLHCTWNTLHSFRILLYNLLSNMKV